MTKPLNIFLIEKNEANRRLVKAYLRKLEEKNIQTNLFILSDPKDYRRFLSRVSIYHILPEPDLLIMGMVFDGVSGYDILDFMRDNDKLHQVKILITTNLIGLRKSGKYPSIYDIIYKPLILKTFKNTIIKYAEQRKHKFNCRVDKEPGSRIKQIVPAT